MRRHFALTCLLAIIAFDRLGAQTIRGTIVDDAKRQPIGDVLLTLLDAAGKETGRSVRSDTLGVFVVQAGRPGTYRVRATRIGFTAQTSEEVALGPGELAILALRMTTVAQQLVPVKVVERRQLTLTELMSKPGFDMRESKGNGRFMNAEKLAEFGKLGTGEVLRSYLRPDVDFADSTDGTYIYMHRGSTGSCAPEIYLDGTILSQPGDSLFRRQFAFGMLEAISADQLYGVEVYRGSEVPPPSYGGSFGSSFGANFGGDLTHPCGVVAVWTKKGRTLAGTAARGPGLSGIQVLRGTVIDFDTGRPRAGVPVRLVNDNKDPAGDIVRSDSLGEFTIKTRRVGTLRLQTGDIGRGEFTTPNFVLTPEELVILKLFVSPKTPVMAPLGIQARLQPDTRPVTDLGSFGYRRERGIAGSFFGVDDISRRHVITLEQLIRGVSGIVNVGTPPTDSIMMRNTLVGDNPLCRPAFFLNGAKVYGNVDAAVKAVSMDRIFGVEVYVKPAEVPAVHADALEGCGMIGIWTRIR